jgi:hypothetical protein
VCALPKDLLQANKKQAPTLSLDAYLFKLCSSPT